MQWQTSTAVFYPFIQWHVGVAFKLLGLAIFEDTSTSSNNTSLWNFHWLHLKLNEVAILVINCLQGIAFFPMTTCCLSQPLYSFTLSEIPFTLFDQRLLWFCKWPRIINKLLDVFFQMLSYPPSLSFSYIWTNCWFITCRLQPHRNSLYVLCFTHLYLSVLSFSNSRSSQMVGDLCGFICENTITIIILLVHRSINLESFSLNLVKMWKNTIISG